MCLLCILGKEIIVYTRENASLRIHCAQFITKDYFWSKEIFTRVHVVLCQSWIIFTFFTYSIVFNHLLIKILSELISFDSHRVSSISGHIMDSWDWSRSRIPMTKPRMFDMFIMNGFRPGRRYLFVSTVITRYHFLKRRKYRQISKSFSN